jgi:polyphosphate kinase 2
MKKEDVIRQYQVELVKLQNTIIAENLKLLVLIEGRDAAGKDGLIKTIVEHLSPRETRVVALGKPSDKQNQQWYFQRYAMHLPSGGEFVLFNRSWYNRAGVEKVMGFCTDKEYRSFFKETELFEKMLTDGGFIVLKYYLDISKAEQRKRLKDREKDPLKQWKISPIDKEALHRWKAYSDARDEMLHKTNFPHAPWFVVNAEHKKKARIAMMAHLLSRLDYQHKNKKLVDRNDGLVFHATPHAMKEKLY